MTLLQAEKLTLALGGRTVLRQVDFAVHPGELVGLIGANGAGKTSLLRVLAGLARPQTGAVRLHGHAIADLTPAERGRAIGYLAQGSDCHWPLPVERLVALGRLPHLQPWQRPGPADRRAIVQAMRAADIEGFAGRPVTTLSAGERVRVLLARALAVETDVLLADEPVAALDPAHQLQVMMLLRARAAAGTAVVVVLHDLTLAARFCQRLVLLAGGEVLAAGTPAAVLTPDHLARAYGVAGIFLTVEGQTLVLPWHRLDDDAAGPAP